MYQDLLLYFSIPVVKETVSVNDILVSVNNHNVIEEDIEDIFSFIELLRYNITKL